MTTPLPNPLLQAHRQAEAEFQTWAELEIVETFGEPQAEYAAIHKSAGLTDLPQRGILELTGNDRLPFLNNLLTNQTWDKSTKKALQPGNGIYAFMLNLRGRIVADMNVLELGERTFLEMDARLVQPLARVLDKYLFAEQVKVTNRVGQLHEIALHGPSAAEVLGVSLERPLQSAQVKLFDSDVIVWRDDPTGFPGYHVIVATESARTIWMNLISKWGGGAAAAAAATAAAPPNQTRPRPLRPIGWAAFNATRIEAGQPIFGIDFDGAPIASALPGKREEPSETAGAGALPAETGLLHRAVSFTKGCYLGQEIVARMDARKQIARQVVGLRMESAALPIAGAQVFDDEQGETPVGVITSSTISPVLSNAAICLAMLKRPHFTMGTKVRIPAEGAIHLATVAQTPFVTPSEPALRPSPA